MSLLLNFSSRVQNMFDNNEKNLVDFQILANNAAHRIYEQYSEKDTKLILINMFDDIMGITPLMSPRKRRQQYRLHKKEWFSIIEDILVDKLESGWNDDPFFMNYVEEKNLELGDKNEFYVDENSILQVSKVAGNHHDIVRQKVGFGKSFSVETSWYGIKVYNDFELFRAGKIDFATQIDKMYEAITKYRKDAIYTAFMSASDALPTDLVVDMPVNSTTVDDIIELVEEVKSATGKDAMIVGTNIALMKLSKTVDYNLFSEDMKKELNTTGKIGNWNGVQLLALSRVNEINSRKELTDNKKLLILPIDPEFKPVKHVFEGDVIYTEDGMDGEKKDMTIDAELLYKEGLAVVINQLFAIINVQ